MLSTVNFSATFRPYKAHKHINFEDTLELAIRELVKRIFGPHKKRKYIFHNIHFTSNPKIVEKGC
jgi:hypothetical protein